VPLEGFAQRVPQLRPRSQTAGQRALGTSVASGAGQ
jgi:hypothetical protein